MTNMLPNENIRSINGSNNNLTNPQFNAVAGADELRLTPANFAPGTSNTPIDGANPRDISNIVASGPQGEDHAPDGQSAWSYVWGQFVDHDLDHTNVDKNHIDIQIPAGDPDLSGTSIPMTRFVTGPSGNAINDITGWIDGSQVYGSDDKTANSLRLPDGHLKTSAGDNLNIVDGAFVSGDVRAAENPDLTAVTTLFVREHNFQVDQLKQEHPDWTGDQLYQMARAIVIAEIENITFSEFLPSIVGKDAIPAYHGYDPSIDPRISQDFASGAFRFGHSIVSGTETKVANNGKELVTQSLAEAFFATPAQVEANGGVDALLRNFAADPAQANDVYAIDGLRNLLFAPPASMDLIAIDIQRERDLGVGSLNQEREALGLKPYTDFNQITSDSQVATNLQKAFTNVDDVDLFIGGLAEDHVAGAMVGETFQKIIAQQFLNIRDGDRLWWQNQGFDDATAQRIQNTTLADIELRNNDTDAIQHQVFIAAERHSSDVASEDPEEPQLVIGTKSDHANVNGGPADDTIVAGLGQNQSLTGGGGGDKFTFGIPNQTSTITDFDPNLDTINFTMSADDFAITQADGHAVIQYDGSDINLMGVMPDQISPSDIVFPIQV